VIRRGLPAEVTIDVERFPENVAALIDGLAPGEELVVTRDGIRIATISGASALEGDVIAPVPPEEGVEVPSPTYDGATVVATAMKLPESARTSLSAELGTDYIVVDLHAAPATADVLLVPPISPQLIGNLRAMFPAARIIVTEIEDDTLGVSYRGPVRRMLDAGAEVYLDSTSVLQLARQLDRTVTRYRQIAGGTTERLEIERNATP
jgi:antitoxin (DNA-binding transcriptional repressor) of toxin-antitoxin stability system